MRRLLLVAVVSLITSIATPAAALTVRDVMELTRAGLGDEILLALIDVDPSVFPIDAATLKKLKDAGVSERVIIAMIRMSVASVRACDACGVPRLRGCRVQARGLSRKSRGKQGEIA